MVIIIIQASILRGECAMGVQGTGSVNSGREISMRKLRRHPRISLKTFHGEIAGKSVSAEGE